MHTESRTRILLVGIALALVATGAWLALRGETSAPVGVDPFAATSSRATTSTDEPGTERTRSASVAADAPRSPAAVRGRVVDATYGVPVRAAVFVDDRAVAWSDERGAFAVPSESTRASARFVAAGYESLDVDLGGADDGERVVRLVPIAPSTVLAIRIDGSPVVGASVAWRAAIDRPERADLAAWIRADAQTSGVAAESETDASGTCRLAIACDSLAVVHDPTTDVRRTVRVRPGRETVVEFPLEPVRLRFVDPSGRPVVGLAVESWAPREADAMSQSARTDADGTVRIAATTYPVLVRSPGAAIACAEWVAKSSGVASDTVLAAQVEIAGPATQVIEVEVRACAARLRLVDASTREPIGARVRVRVRSVECREDAADVTACTIQTARCAVQATDVLESAGDGVLALPCALAQQLVDGESAGGRLVVAVEGRVSRVLDGSALRALDPGATHEIELVPAVQRRLRFVDADGRPIRRAVTVHSPRHDALVWQDLARDDGLHGPMDWFGGDLRVRLDFGDAWDVVVPESELAAAEEVVVRVAAAFGAIELRDVPRDAAVSAIEARLGVGSESVSYLPTSSASGVLRFERVPVGSYLVGPARWIDGAEKLTITLDPKDGMRTLDVRTRVDADRVAVVAWQRAWSAGRRYEGRVRVDGVSAAQVFLVPAYAADVPDEVTRAAGAPRMVFGRRSVRIPLDRDGRYVVEPHEPMPHVIAVCVAWDGPWGTVQGLQVVESLLPGESADVATVTIELRCGKRPDKTPVDVTLVVPPTALRHELTTFHTTRRFRWDPAHPLVISGVPVSVRELRVAGKPVAVRLERGERRVVEWSPPESTPDAPR